MWQRRLLTEHVVRLALAEAIQSQVAGKLIPEFNHPDIPGNTSLDLIVMSPRDKTIEVACELKWVRKTTEKHQGIGSQRSSVTFLGLNA